MLNKSRILILISSVFLFGLTSKWYIIQTYGSDVPYHDPWGAEALVTIIPWLDGELNYWENFWAPHNEHIIGWTRLWSLFLTSISGQWDNQFVCTINALVHCFAVTITIFFFRKYLVGPGVWIIPVVCSQTLSSNLSWENTLGCFQFQFYISQLFAIIYIYFSSKLNSVKYLIFSILTAIIALPTMPSNIFPIIAVLITNILLLTRNKYNNKITIRLIAITVLLIISLSLYNPVPYHEKLEAQSIVEFSKSIINILSLFYFNSTSLNFILFFIINLPIIIFLYHIYRVNFSLKNSNYFLLTSYTIYVLISIASLAYSRYELSNSSRYFDTYFMIAIANSVCIVCLWIKYKNKHKFYFNFSILCWFFTISIVLLRSDSNTLIAMDKKWRGIEYNLRQYAFNKDDTLLSNSELPYIDKNTILTVMNHPKMLDYLPTSIRKPIKYSNEIPYKKLENLNDNSTYKINHYLANDERKILISDIFYTDKLKSFVRIYFQGSSSLFSSCISLNSKNGDEILLGDKNLKAGDWQTGHFRINNEFQNFNIKVNADQNNGWIAISDLYEVSYCSWLTRQIRKQSPFFKNIGLILGFIIIGIKISKDYSIRP